MCHSYWMIMVVICDWFCAFAFIWLTKNWEWGQTGGVNLVRPSDYHNSISRGKICEPSDFNRHQHQLSCLLSCCHDKKIRLPAAGTTNLSVNPTWVSAGCPATCNPASSSSGGLLPASSGSGCSDMPSATSTCPQQKHNSQSGGIQYSSLGVRTCFLFRRCIKTYVKTKHQHCVAKSPAEPSRTKHQTLTSQMIELFEEENSGLINRSDMRIDTLDNWTEESGLWSSGPLSRSASSVVAHHLVTRWSGTWVPVLQTNPLFWRQPIVRAASYHLQGKVTPSRMLRWWSDCGIRDKCGDFWSHFCGGITDETLASTYVTVAVHSCLFTLLRIFVRECETSLRVHLVFWCC